MQVARAHLAFVWTVLLFCIKMLDIKICSLYSYSRHSPLVRTSHWKKCHFFFVIASLFLFQCVCVFIFSLGGFSLLFPILFRFCLCSVFFFFILILHYGWSEAAYYIHCRNGNKKVSLVAQSQLPRNSNNYVDGHIDCYNALVFEHFVYLFPTKHLVFVTMSDYRKTLKTMPKKLCWLSTINRMTTRRKHSETHWIGLFTTCESDFF